METVLYADILFLVNYAMDFISLSASASLGARSKSAVRMSIASVLGSVYAICATVSSINGAMNYILAVAVGAAMCAIAFDFGGILPFLRQYVTFWCCSALLGGIMTALLSLGNAGFSTSNIPIMIIAASGILIFMIKALKDRAGCKSLKIKIFLSGKCTSFDALCDSGNLLRDPFSSAPVILVSHEVLTPLLPHKTIKAMLENDESITAENLKIRLIPQCSANDSRLLCAFFPDRITVSSKKRSVDAKCLIAVSPHHNTYFAGFAATAPSILIP